MSNTNTSVYVLIGQISRSSTDIRGIYTTRDLAESAKDVLEAHYHPYDRVFILRKPLLDSIEEPPIMSNKRIDVDGLESDTLHVEDGALDQLVSAFRTQSMAIPSGTDPRIEAHRLVIDVGETALEITAPDDTVEIREVPDE